MATIREVAELAGVSVATVSRALQQPQRVSPKTRHRVMEAVSSTGYKPNLMAVKFRSGKTHTLVVLVPTVANVFFARVIDGLQEAAKARGYTLLLGNTQGNPRLEEDYAKMVQTAQADGLIQLRAHNPFAPPQAQVNTPARPTSGLLPMVNACEVLPSEHYPTVSLDNRAAARSMTEHLLHLGHTRIGVIQGPTASPLTQQRLAGYQDALATAGVIFDASLLVDGDFTLKAGYQAAQRLLQQANRPTALFCENDETAMGALQAVKQAGLRIPQDISVAGFDDIAFAAYCDPPLTTIAQPAEQFGQTAVALLLDVLEGKITQAPKVTVPYELIVRASTGPAPITADSGE